MAATLASWQPFFAARLGAGAALLGLLFDALSLNLDRLLAFPSLPPRAEISLLLLAPRLVICSIMLIPDQGAAATGADALPLACVIWGSDHDAQPAYPAGRRREATMRIIGMDIHRVPTEVVALIDGEVRRLGRIPMLRDRLEAFAPPWRGTWRRST